MGRLTKLKNVFSKENIKKGVRIGVLTAGMAFTAIGLTGCIQQASLPDNEKEKCNEDGCVLDEHPETVKHDYCNEYGCEVEGNKTDDEPHKHCKETNCKNKTAYTDIHDHDYCGLGDEVCFGIDKTTNSEHDHDYCEKTDCNGSTHMGTVHPTETTYPDWFQEEYIGGEGSPYKIMFPVESEYLGAVNSNTDPILQLNSYSVQFKKYIQDLTFSEDFKEKYNTDIAFKTFDNYNSSEESKLHYNKNFDYLIGTINDDVSGSINDVCAPVFRNIMENLNNTDKQLLYVYYNALKNETKKYNYYTNNTTEVTSTYTNTKNNEIKIFDNNELIPFNSFYQTVTDKDGKNSEVINPQVATEMTNILQKAANNNKELLSNYQNIVNLSFVSDMLEMTDNYTTQITKHSSCKDHTNQMTGVIENEIGM